MPEWEALALLAIVAPGIVAGNAALLFYLEVAGAPTRPDGVGDATLILLIGIQATIGLWLEDWLRYSGRWHLTILTVAGLAAWLLPDSPFWWFANRFGPWGAWIIVGAFSAFVLSFPLGAFYFRNRARELHGSGRP